MNNELQKVNNGIVNAETLIQTAIEKNVSVESLEKLLSMRTQLKKEWAQEQYYKNLSEFQKECPVIKKTNGVKGKDGKTRYFYASLDEIISQIKDYLQKYGFSYNVKTKQETGSVTAICIAHHVSGHSEETEFKIPIDPEAYMNAAQKVASALTFAKRYAFCNSFGIMTGDEDDDSNSTPAEEKPTAKQSSEKTIDYSREPKSGKAWSKAPDKTLIAAYAFYKADAGYSSAILSELKIRGLDKNIAPVKHASTVKEIIPDEKEVAIMFDDEESVGVK